MQTTDFVGRTCGACGGNGNRDGEDNKPPFFRTLPDCIWCKGRGKVPEFIEQVPGELAIVVRRRSDANDYRRCAKCGHSFGAGAIARRISDDALIHGFDFDCSDPNRW